MIASNPAQLYEHTQEMGRWVSQKLLLFLGWHPCRLFVGLSTREYSAAFRFEEMMPTTKRWAGLGGAEGKPFRFFFSPPRARPCRRLCVMCIYIYIYIYVRLLYWNSYVAAAGVNSAFPITSHDKKWNARLPISPVCHSADTLYPVWPSWKPLLNTESFFYRHNDKKRVSPLY